MSRVQFASPAIAVVLACLLAACSSESEGAGGSSATGSSTSSATSTVTATAGSGATTSSSTGGTGGCTFGDPAACKTGEYCDAPDCQTGTCAPLGVEAGVKAPVCGCDGVTYWNGATAASQGMSVAATGVCMTATPCGGAGNVACAAGLYCNIPLTDPADCAASPSGECWGMPKECPAGVGFGGSLSTCDADPWCIDECSIIKSSEPYFADACPL